MADETQTTPETSASTETPKPKTVRETQAEQAAARTALAEINKPAAPTPVQTMDLDELAAEIDRQEARLLDLETKVHKATARRDEIITHICTLRQQKEAAEKQSFEEGNRDYLEGVKAEYVGRFADALRVRNALKDAGIGHMAGAMVKVGLGVSAVDQAIAKDLSERRKNYALEQAIAAKGKQGG